jgi:hypothetical protein
MGSKLVHLVMVLVVLFVASAFHDLSETPRLSESTASSVISDADAGYDQAAFDACVDAATDSVCE